MKRFSTEGMHDFKSAWNDGTPFELKAQFQNENDKDGFVIGRLTECKPVTVEMRFKLLPARYIINRDGRVFKWIGWRRIDGS